MKKLLIAASLVGLAALSLAQNSLSGVVGKKAPAFSFTTLEGKKLTNASLKGKVVVLDFWASWCGNCLKASPTMNSLHDKYASKGVVVVGVNALEKKPRPAASEKYKKDHETRYQLVSDGDAAHKKYGVPGLPVIVVIGKDGLIKAAFDDFAGAETAAKIEAAVKSAL
jgi:cytochrome c biogenesis protein CcmG/thiol:disulfide interchange protein DsbE